MSSIFSFVGEYLDNKINNATKNIAVEIEKHIDIKINDLKSYMDKKIESYIDSKVNYKAAA